MHRLTTAAALLVAASAITACNNDSNGTSATNAADAGNGSGPVTEGPSVPLVDSKGNIIGKVQGGDSDDGARLLIEARGLPPGSHGIHIHETGLCEPPDFKSAGGHWNPAGKQHGGDNPNGAHAGDLENMIVASDGSVRAEIIVPNAFIQKEGRNAGPGSFEIADADGAAVVIHVDPDDYRTDPSGNSGERIACAVLASPQAGAPAAQ
jgi:Cu-Zn family superoxide dismutase